MGILTRMRKQTCVHWPMASQDSGGEDYDDFGSPQLTTPVELTVRWDEVNEEFVGANQQRELSKAMVYTGVDVRVGEVLMLGTLSDIEAGVDPRDQEGAYEIKRFDKTPNLKATEFLRIAYL